jgi:hypothetical protein
VHHRGGCVMRTFISRSEGPSGPSAVNRPFLPRFVLFVVALSLRNRAWLHYSHVGNLLRVPQLLQATNSSSTFPNAICRLTNRLKSFCTQNQTFGINFFSDRKQGSLHIRICQNRNFLGVPGKNQGFYCESKGNCSPHYRNRSS